jgi:hypothetical protein
MLASANAEFQRRPLNSFSALQECRNLTYMIVDANVKIFSTVLLKKYGMM